MRYSTGIKYARNTVMARMKLGRLRCLHRAVREKLGLYGHVQHAQVNSIKSCQYSAPRWTTILGPDIGLGSDAGPS